MHWVLKICPNGLAVLKSHRVGCRVQAGVTPLCATSAPQGYVSPLSGKALIWGTSSVEQIQNPSEPHPQEM